MEERQLVVLSKADTAVVAKFVVEEVVDIQLEVANYKVGIVVVVAALVRIDYLQSNNPSDKIAAGCRLKKLCNC